MMEQHHDGHEWSPARRQVLGELRANLEHARSRLEELEGEPAGPKGEAGRGSAPGAKGKLAAIAAAAALDLLARRAAGSAAPEPRREGPGLLKLAVFSAAVIAIGKLITAKR